MKEQSDNTVYDVVIVGGGITGMATAAGLLRRNVTNILVLERATSMHPVGASIALFANGLRALQYLSPAVAAKVGESSIPIKSMVMRDLEGNLIRETTPPGDARVHYLVWYLLQRYLAQELPDGVLRLGCAVDSFCVNDEEGGDGSDGNNIVTIVTSNSGGTQTTIRSRVLVGADGIRSPTRERLFGPDVATKEYRHDKVMYRAVLPAAPAPTSSDENPLPLPPRGTNVSFQGDEPGKIFHYRETATGILTVTSMARIVDDDDSHGPSSPCGSQHGSSTPEEKKEQMLRVFEGYPPEVQSLLERIPPEAVHVTDIRDIDVLQRWSDGPVIVIGDAAHAMSPSMGQGANQGLEDACAVVHGLASVLLPSSAATSAAATAKAVAGARSTSSSLPPPSSSSKAVPNALESIWQSRIDRVSRIHAASRSRSRNNNHSSKSRPIDMDSEELKEVLRYIDAWEAPVDG